MGIGGSIIDPEFIEEYLGMRVESVDEVEIIRRMTEGIYDEKEYQKALKWTQENVQGRLRQEPREPCRRPASRRKRIGNSRSR